MTLDSLTRFERIQASCVEEWTDILFCAFGEGGTLSPDGLPSTASLERENDMGLQRDKL